MKHKVNSQAAQDTQSPTCGVMSINAALEFPF